MVERLWRNNKFAFSLIDFFDFCIEKYRFKRDCIVELTMLCSILKRAFDLLKFSPHLMSSEERLYFYNVLYQYIKLTIFVGWVAACAQLEQPSPRRV